MQSFDETFAEQVAHLCYSKFETLPKSGKPVPGSQWTPIAAIVKHQIHVGTSVLSLGTGSKCIGQSKLSARGDIINDSHAEVLARRGFMRYLYEQIELANEERSEIFALDSSKERIELQRGVTFHLFTSQTPCGDACIFPIPRDPRHDSGRTDVARKRSPSRDASDTPSEKYRRVRWDSSPSERVANVDVEIDVHRTGAKCLPDETRQDPKLSGIRYHVVGTVRTKPGRGDRTLSVSCSDKILRWNYVGVQGALLAFLIEPIYLSSIVVSCDEELYSQNAMYRAVVNRNPALDQIRPMNVSPTLLHTRLRFQYSKSSFDTLKPSPCSIVWYNSNSTSKNHEVYVEGRRSGWTKKAKNVECEPALVSKKQLLRCFKRMTKTKFDEWTYASCKMLSTRYQKEWNDFKKIVGPWTEKDERLLAFK